MIDENGRFTIEKGSPESEALTRTLLRLHENSSAKIDLGNDVLASFVMGTTSNILLSVKTSDKTVNIKLQADGNVGASETWQWTCQTLILSNRVREKLSNALLADESVEAIS